MSLSKRFWLWCTCVVAVLVVGLPARAGQVDDVAYTNPGDLPRLRLTDGSEELPLKHTDVSAEITGFVAEVEVRQTYRNTHKKPIEAVYVFPLPENSAVSDMEIVIGKRTIKAEIQRRADARETYEAARAQGHTAALLEQERANIFTQSVANIAPGEDIDVVIRYVQDLTYDAGEYEFVFPMVVGPRYVAGKPLARPSQGRGRLADTDQVPDASRITPPVVGKGTRTGHDISVAVRIDAGLPIGSISIPNHKTRTKRGKGGLTTVTLAERKSIPNRDFVLRYRVDGPQVQSTLFLAEGKGERFFTLLMQPPTADVDDLVGERELIFVVDVSGSMDGVPLALCKAAMQEAIRRLRPVDTFNVLTFSGGTGQAFARPRPANQHNIREALSYVSGLRAGGGTEILNAVDAALSPPVGEGRHRYVFFLTDGFVSIEDAVYGRTRRWVRKLADKGQRARVFAMGTGSSPNRELLSKLTKAGQGVMVTASNREDPNRAVGKFYRYIDHPVFTDVQVAWGKTRASETHPHRIQDLYVSRPGITHGRLEGAAPRSLELVGKMGGKRVRIPVKVETLSAGPGAVQARLWARARIEDLEHAMIFHQDPAYETEITKLGLDHRLVTRYTSFVAVDRSRKVGNGDPTRVDQPTDVPEGVDAEMAGGYVVNSRAAMDYADEPLMGESVEADEMRSIVSVRSRRRRAGRRGGGAGCAHCRSTGAQPPLGLSLLFLAALLLRRRARVSRTRRARSARRHPATGHRTRG